MPIHKYCVHNHRIVTALDVSYVFVVMHSANSNYFQYYTKIKQKKSRKDETRGSIFLCNNDLILLKNSDYL